MDAEIAIRQVLSAWGVEAGVKLDAIWCIENGADPEEVASTVQIIAHRLGKLETIKQTLAEENQRKAKIR